MCPVRSVTYVSGRSFQTNNLQTSIRPPGFSALFGVDFADVVSVVGFLGLSLKVFLSDNHRSAPQSKPLAFQKHSEQEFMSAALISGNGTNLTF
jgi:hypothetical protein